MIIELIANRVNSLAEKGDVIILKGFPSRVIKQVAEQTICRLYDDYVYTDKGIDLSIALNCAGQIMACLYQTNDTAGLISYESFIAFAASFNNLDILGKKFVIVENNILLRFENPSTENIPDFDSSDFQNEQPQNEIFTLFYSFCQHKNGKEYIQYNDQVFENSHCIQTIPLVKPGRPSFHNTVDTNLPVLSSDDDSVVQCFEYIFCNGALPYTKYAIDKQHLEEEWVKILSGIAPLLNSEIQFAIFENSVHQEIRPELYDILKKVWNYDSFRDLEIYKDLNIDHTTTKVSQGEVIETVVREAENALNKHPMKNVLLTAPTGAGKSLLFQLAAIYLAEHYESLTIIISPLVALMNDQVINLQHRYPHVATLNGNQTIIERETIQQGILDGDINILYLAPELLLSYTINTFIGDRKIGLLVVDEAHTVTTWGRDFRVDYWFLGDYLRQSKRILDYQFPIFALTATAVWDPTRRNDMVFDTISSLCMDPCIKYIGCVRRSNIRFEISTPKIERNYEDWRNKQTIMRIGEAIDDVRKTIVYFPFKSTISQLQRYQEIVPALPFITEYHSDLTGDQKKANARDFTSGERFIMCATKAYGMGIDVSDISEVYHHAPTGNLSDYVQEIGRLARDPKIIGIAKIDFTEKDFKYTRMLHGLSAIRPYQLFLVLKKLMGIYKLKGEKRNMLINASDFEYIFPGKDVDYDQKVKSCLLLISNDLLVKLRFHAMIVRPKSLFTKSYIKVKSTEVASFESRYKNYAKLVDPMTSTFLVDAEKLWQHKYTDKTFAAFKQMVATGGVFGAFHTEVYNRVEVNLAENVEDAKSALLSFFRIAHMYLDKMASDHHRISMDDMKSSLPHGYTPEQKNAFIETFKLLYTSPHALGADTNSYCKIFTTTRATNTLDDIESFQLVSGGYEAVKNNYLEAFESHIHSTEFVEFCPPTSRLIKIAELLNSLNLADYVRTGGEQPAIFVRINNPHYLNQIIRSGNYHNNILHSIYEKYSYSEKVFTHFFTTTLTNEQRWDFIEAYFLGASEEELFAIGKE